MYNTFLGLYSLQHRGEESCGIASTNGTEIVSHRAMGLVSDVLTPEVLAGLKNRVAIGHVRYSTTGGSRLENAQPFVAAYSGGPIALAHNGNLVNTAELRRDYERQRRRVSDHDRYGSHRPRHREVRRLSRRAPTANASTR